MPELSGLGASAGQGDGKVAQNAVSFGAATVRERSYWKRKHVRGLILPPEIAV
jgi:hypothetical protein